MADIFILKRIEFMQEGIRMYTFDSRVRYSETAPDGRITLEGIVDYLQDCSSFQSDDIGHGVEQIAENNRMWILTFWQIIIKKYPVMSEKITIGTGAYGFDKILGFRNFLISDSQGNDMVLANSVWAFMDIAKQRPIMVTEDEDAAYGKIEKLDMEYAPRKIKIPKVNGIACEAVKVMLGNIDLHNHVNNAQYIRMAVNALAEVDEARIEKINEIRAEYKKQAGINAVINPVVYIENDDIVIKLNDEDGKAYAVVWFGI